MTVICAITDGTRTVIGSDTAATAGEVHIKGMVEKWLVGDKWALGCAGDHRTLQVLRGQDLDGFEAHAAAELIKAALVEDGYKSADEHGTQGYGNSFILATPGKVWDICEGFSVVEIPPNRLWARGSGRELALGAGHAWARSSLGPELERAVSWAIGAACEYNAHCDGQWIHELT